MRPIDADAMLEYLDLMYDKQDDWIEPYNVGVLGAIYYIKHKAPTIDVDRPKGEWIEYESDTDKYDDIRCSCCQRLFTVDSYHFTDIGFTKDDLKFCPQCGADMRGEKDE